MPSDRAERVKDDARFDVVADVLARNGLLVHGQLARQILDALDRAFASSVSVPEAETTPTFSFDSPAETQVLRKRLEQRITDLNIATIYHDDEGARAAELFIYEIFDALATAPTGEPELGSCVVHSHIRARRGKDGTIWRCEKCGQLFTPLAVSAGTPRKPEDDIRGLEVLARASLHVCGVVVRNRDGVEREVSCDDSPDEGFREFLQRACDLNETPAEVASAVLPASSPVPSTPETT